MTDLMTNTRLRPPTATISVTLRPDTTETQRACDIIRQVRDLFEDGLNWVQGAWAKRPSSEDYDVYDQTDSYTPYGSDGNSLDPRDSAAVKFCLVGAIAHVADVDFNDYRYWTGPAGKVLDLILDTGEIGNYRSDVVYYNDGENTTWDKIDNRLEQALELCIKEATQ